MQTIDKTEQEIIDEFSIYDDWMDKYAVIIEQGNALAPLDEQYKTEHLSPTRSNGLLSVIKQIRFYAIAYKAKAEQQQQG